MHLGNRAVRTCPFVLLTSFAVLVLVVPPPSTGPAVSDAYRSVLERPTDPGPYVSVDPASWWMMVGNVTALTATWVDPSPACALLGDWFHWSLEGVPAEGWLDSTTGPSVNFTAAAVATGNATVVVRAAATLDCGFRSTVIVASADSNITVTAPLSIRNLSVSPNPIRPGGSCVLTGNVSGGEPPYDLRVTWGDGLSSNATLASAGILSLPHEFEAGEYTPTLFVSDSDGLLAHASVPEAVQSSNFLEIGLTSNQTATDLDVPVQFNATVLNDPWDLPIGWSCDEGLPYTFSLLTSSLRFSCSFPYAGIDPVRVEVVPNQASSFQTATLPIDVAPPPGLTPVWSNLTTEAGIPVSVAFNVSGGVPPFRLEWTGGGPGLEGALPVPSDGTVLATVRPSEAGSFGFTAQLVDSDRAVVSNSRVRIHVYPALELPTPSVRSPGNSSGAANLTDAVIAGAPPFRWIVSPGSQPTWSSNETGTLDSVGSFDWAGEFEEEGTATVTVLVEDATGALANASVVIGMVAPLVGNLTVRLATDPPGGNLSLDLNLSGGRPPFDVVVRASDGEEWTRNTSSDGTQLWVITPHARGALDIRVTVADGLGYTLAWNEHVDLPPLPPNSVPGSDPPPAASSSYPVAGLFVLGVLPLAAVAYIYRRRRSRAAKPPRPDAEAVLRRIIEPADGADRATVELLAEEEGVPLEVARSTIDRLIASGAIRSESTGDAEEVVSWSAAPDA